MKYDGPYTSKARYTEALESKNAGAELHGSADVNILVGPQDPVTSVRRHAAMVTEEGNQNADKAIADIQAKHATTMKGIEALGATRKTVTAALHHKDAASFTAAIETLGHAVENAPKAEGLHTTMLRAEAIQKAARIAAGEEEISTRR